MPRSPSSRRAPLAPRPAKNRRVRILAAALLVALLALATGFRTHTQTGWRLDASSTARLASGSADTRLRVKLVDTRDQRRLSYDWGFPAPPPGATPPPVEVDCGEYRRIFLWHFDTGLALDGARFRRTIPFGTSATGTEGPYLYDYRWETTSPSTPSL